MYLEKLEIHGFKSFAHKTSLEFPAPRGGQRGITAVVGPNGSGKSNIADAIRWVLGEQSMKLLRGKKAEDVIFAGSDKKTRLGLAEVSLHLNNDDHSAPIDYSEVVITRRVLRSGEGEYMLNRNPVRLHDILFFLAKANFGQRTYSIIGQGTVDEVLLQTPTQRKEFFDEAAGVRAFQIKREQAVSKLEQTKENLRQIDLLIQEITPRLRSLTRQVKRLEQREEVAKALTDKQLAYYRAVFAELNGKLEDVRNRKQRAEKEKEAIDRRGHELEQKLSAWRRGDTREAEFTAVRVAYEKLVEAKNALLRERAALQGKIDAGRTSAGEANVVWLERKREELQTEERRLKAERQQTEERRTRVELALEEKEESVDSIETELAEAEAELRKSQEALSRHVMTLPELREAVEWAFDEQRNFFERVRKATTVEDLAALKSEAERLNGKFAAFLDDVRSQIPEASPEAMKKLQEKVSRLLEEKDRIFEEAADLRTEVKVFAERVEALDGRIRDHGVERQSVGRELEVSQARGDDRTAVVKAQLADLDRKLGEHERKLAEAQAKLSGFHEAAQEKQDTLLSLQQEFAKTQDSLRVRSEEVNDFAVELARLETRAEDLERELREALPDQAGEVRRSQNIEGNVDTDAQYRDIQRLRGKLELIGGIDPQVGEEYRQTKERHDFLSSQHEDLTNAVEDLEGGVENLDATIKERFDAAFAKINEEFGKFFKILFAGGRAGLELVKEEIVPEGPEVEEGEQVEPAEEVKPARGPKVITGIEIHATPPGKRLKSITMLSGGERALTAIALICAIIASNPSPFVVLDEVDAALDEANSIRFAQIIEKLAQKAQFIMISHNRATMERGDVLYGVTMTDDGVSHLLSVKMEEAEKVIATHGNR